MGVKLTQSEARNMVLAFRSLYPEVVFYWNYLEDAFLAAYKTKKRQQVGAIYFTATAEAVKIELPSGRCLHYLNPHAWRGQDGLHLSFDGLRAGGWGRQSTYGGRLTENIVQAVARDVLAEGMVRAEKMGFTIVGHVHDELISMVPDVFWVPERGPTKYGPKESVKLLEGAMSSPIDWAPGLPLAAEGYESEFYMKG
jgi:DNA polymerase bacteriophage-type